MKGRVIVLTGGDKDSIGFGLKLEDLVGWFLTLLEGVVTVMKGAEFGSTEGVESLTVGRTLESETARDVKVPSVHDRSSMWRI